MKTHDVWPQNEGSRQKMHIHNVFVFFCLCRKTLQHDNPTPLEASGRETAPTPPTTSAGHENVGATTCEKSNLSSSNVIPGASFVAGNANVDSNNYRRSPSSRSIERVDTKKLATAVLVESTKALTLNRILPKCLRATQWCIMRVLSTSLGVEVLNDG